MKKKLRKIPTPSYLANVALHYLQRYAASEASLRRVLINRIRRAAMQHPAFAADHEKQALLRDALEKIIADHKKTGVINDAAFAATKINSLRRQGRSRRVIQQKLAVKGIASETIHSAISAHEEDENPEAIEFKAALALARRRKVGPFRKNPQESDQDRRRKEMAILARGGYAMGVIFQVLNLSSDDYEELNEGYL